MKRMEIASFDVGHLSSSEVGTNTAHSSSTRQMTATVSILPVSPADSEENEPLTKYLIIGGSCLAALLLILMVVAIALKKRRERAASRGTRAVPRDSGGYDEVSGQVNAPTQQYANTQNDETDVQYESVDDTGYLARRLESTRASPTPLDNDIPLSMAPQGPTPGPTYTALLPSRDREGQPYTSFNISGPAEDVSYEAMHVTEYVNTTDSLAQPSPTGLDNSQSAGPRHTAPTADPTYTRLATPIDAEAHPYESLGDRNEVQSDQDPRHTDTDYINVAQI